MSSRLAAPPHQLRIFFWAPISDGGDDAPDRPRARAACAQRRRRPAASSMEGAPIVATLLYFLFPPTSLYATLA